MQSFLSLVKNSKFAKNITSLALGKFDGLHLGHQALFKELDENGAILCIEQENGVLLPKKYRSFYAKYPMFYIALDIIRNKSDKEFVAFLQSVLPNLRRIVVGYDFRFGKDRFYYPFDLLQSFKGEVVVVNEVLCKKLSVHSGLIKELLLNGNVKQASKFLGRLYEIRGEIIKGQGLGKRELYATINLQNDGFLLPQEGVYAGFIQLGEQKLESKKYPAVIFIGNRLSTDKSFSIEGHLLGIEVEVKESEAGFYFAKKIRNNRKFDNLESLKKQISCDINEAYKILKVK
ncbi:bifunctional riboflavin kinase/FAD synthetase [Helicobacter winghamensis]|uniref:Riboflavin biosynthesis protein n=1 Tax=Helicobacter winghamensis TaxID=157268 RepID=A0A2N3PKE8_9HELI|nr:bifunctional riboflavin kinase/FAD synthetase [Helicobacter winghamensis]EEO25940.1 riboflavin biosynthesis protein RibF [Helicobacter winghamensis ATCC BAA-430]PKT76956.1 bifunctional riboflavin kinase/FMN adenylyltransferase [Helicobacter winghamensis]PKT77096.1 bifunctional riboflavin kinase/FMN adenylyltransferase [Helicobacter winghamensis]PKT77657.1 bifunctional riboflavin kinase/FMN adenylyltransferase [Helicobacter winghamensis]PKT81895.1 bifunctional riboflavin kinase/FMN adenylylt